MAKLPNRIVLSDSLVIVVDGVEYRTHEGETVTFRGGRETVTEALAEMQAMNLEVEVLSLAQEVQSIPSTEAEASIGKVQAFLAKSADLQAREDAKLERLQRRIVSWTWTDPDGSAYPSPPTVDVLRTLEREEIAWLTEASKKTPDPLGSTASTTP
jgi:hypothetical protein